MNETERKNLMEAVNTSGGLWFRSEFVTIAGWGTMNACISPTWGGFYHTSWDEVKRALEV